MHLLRGIPAAVRNTGQGVPNVGLCDPLVMKNNGTAGRWRVNGEGEVVAGNGQCAATELDRFRWPRPGARRKLVRERLTSIFEIFSFLPKVY